jgi:hypothetical protein
MDPRDNVSRSRRRCRDQFGIYSGRSNYGKQMIRQDVGKASLQERDVRRPAQHFPLYDA